MTNATYSLGVIALIFIFITLGLLTWTSIWILPLSIYLSSIINLSDNEDSYTQKKWFRSLSKFIQEYTSWPKEETHSFYFVFLISLCLLPITIYLNRVDWSSIIDNTLMVIIWLSSHLIISMFSERGIPLFYCPKINPIWKAQYYTWNNFLSNIFKGLSDIIYNQAKKTTKWTLNSLWGKMKEVSKKTSFNFKMSDEQNPNESLIFTLPLLVLVILLIFMNIWYIHIKLLNNATLLTSNILLSIFLIIYSIRWNYLLRSEGWLKDFIEGLIDKSNNWSDLLEILESENLTKISLLLVLIWTLFFNYTTILVNIENTFTQMQLSLTLEGDNIVEKGVNFFSKILDYLI